MRRLSARSVALTPSPAAVARAEPTVPRARHGARLVLILGALSAFAPLSIDMYLPALPALGRDFGTGASQVQLTLSPLPTS